MLTSHWADSSPRLGWKTSRAGDNNAGRLTLVMHGAGEFNYSCSPAARSAPPHCCCPRYRAESSWHRLSRLGLASPAPPAAGLTGSSNSGQAQRTTDTFLQNYQIKTLFSQLYLINVAMKILIEMILADVIMRALFHSRDFQSWTGSEWRDWSAAGADSLDPWPPARPSHYCLLPAHKLIWNIEMGRL